MKIFKVFTKKVFTKIEAFYHTHKRQIIAILIIILAVCILPLPIPRFKTLYGECLKCRETAKVEFKCLELRFFLLPDRMYGSVYIKIGDSGEKVRYQIINQSNRIFRSAPDGIENVSVRLYRYSDIDSSYIIYSDKSKTHTVLSENKFNWSDESLDETLAKQEHFLVVSPSGDTEEVIEFYSGKKVDLKQWMDSAQ